MLLVSRGAGKFVTFMKEIYKRSWFAKGNAECHFIIKEKVKSRCAMNAGFL